MGKTFKRVAVGGGKFCYSGPDCRMHGEDANPTLNKVASKNNVVTASSVAVISETIQNIAASVQDSICVSSFDLKDISELQENSLMLHVAVNKCEIHNVCHVYKVKTAEATIKTLHKPVYKLISLLQKDNLLSTEDAALLRSSILVNMENLKLKIVDADTYFLTEYQKSIVGSPLHDLAIKELASGTNNAIAKSIYNPDLRNHYLVVQIPAEQVSEELLLEYWKCGRKKRHNSVENARKSMPSQFASGEVQAYECPYCEKFHVGHGGGDFSLKAQLSKSREHWSANPEKANLFSSWKHLM